MTALVIAEAVAIVLLGFLVAGLLRSHADILRALHRLGIDANGSPSGRDAPVGLARRSPTAGAAPVATGDGRAAVDLIGRSPADEALKIPVTSVRHDTLLAFLTTGCTTCATFWRALGQAGLAVPGGARVVVVVHDAAEESISRVRSLASARVRVVMSSDAWDSYGVAYAPYFVYVSGLSGRVVGEGVAGSWEELVSLLDQARADGGGGGRGAGTGRGGERDRLEPGDRERRIDDDLRRAGILPGDPTLYPTHLETAPARSHETSPAERAATAERAAPAERAATAERAGTDGGDSRGQPGTAGGR